MSAALHLAEKETRVSTPEADTTLTTLVERKVAERFAPTATALGRLRQALDDWEQYEREHIGHEMLRGVRLALGEEPPLDLPATTEFAEELRGALAQVGVLLDPTNATIPAPAPSAVSVAPSAPPPDKRRPATPADLEEGARLMGEIQSIGREWKDQHPSRLAPLLQAIAAESRGLIDRLPRDDDMADRLGRSMSIISRVRRDAQVSRFIYGLTYEGQERDWHKLAHGCRRAVKNFDRDADHSDTALKKKEPAPPQRARKQHDKRGPVSTPLLLNLPHLKARAAEAPIVIAGGMQIPERLESARSRSLLGDRLTWHAIDHNNPRAAETLVARVRAGNVGALILIEGFMRHDTFKPLSDAATSASVPYAYAGKGGTAGLEEAMMELDRRLAAKDAR